MIVCSCNVLTKSRIVDAARRLSDSDPDRPVTPGRILRAMGARPQCGSCLSLVRRIVADSGVPFTCPEPLAMDAEGEATYATEQVDSVFDVGH